MSFGLWGVCYALDKKAFVQEAHRLLKPNGCFILADGYAKKNEFNKTEWQKLQTFLDGYEVPDVTTEAYLTGHLRESGFKEIQFVDITENIVPSTKRLRNIAVFSYPLDRIATWLRLRTPTQSKLYQNTLNQCDLINENLVRYGIFLARKVSNY